MDKAQELFREKVDKVLNYKTYSDQKKIDTLLFMNADQYCNLGIESNKYERHQAESNSRYIYRAIKTLNEHLGRLLLKNREE